MQAVFDSFGPVVIIGSDIPGIGTQHIAAAFHAFSSADAVIGPADDGGYWLIGVSHRRRRMAPFSNVRWSTEHTLADTMRGFADAKVALISTLTDIDHADEWRAWSHQPASARLNGLRLP